MFCAIFDRTTMNNDMHWEPFSHASNKKKHKSMLLCRVFFRVEFDGIIRFCLAAPKSMFFISITKLLDALSSLSSNRTRAVSWAPSRRSLGAPSATWAPLLARSGLDWLALTAPGALAGSIWPRLARSGCPCCPGWLDLAALCAPGRPSWLDLAPNDYPIDTISQKENDLLIDDPASMLPASCALEHFFMPQI